MVVLCGSGNHRTTFTPFPAFSAHCKLLYHSLWFRLARLAFLMSNKQVATIRLRQSYMNCKQSSALPVEIGSWKLKGSHHIVICRLLHILQRQSQRSTPRHAHSCHHTQSSRPFMNYTAITGQAPELSSCGGVRILINHSVPGRMTCAQCE